MLSRPRNHHLLPYEVTNFMFDQHVMSMVLQIIFIMIFMHTWYYVENIVSIFWWVYLLLQAINSSSPQFLRRLDARSLRSLSGVRVNEQIVQLVPNAEVTKWSVSVDSFTYSCDLLGMEFPLDLLSSLAGPSVEPSSVWGMAQLRCLIWPASRVSSMKTVSAAMSAPDHQSLMGIVQRYCHVGYGE
jgi:hypothetical protein